jgi:hypothetical protein
MKNAHELRIVELDAEIMRLTQQLNEDRGEHEKEEKHMTAVYDAQDQQYVNALEGYDDDMNKLNEKLTQ